LHMGWVLITRVIVLRIVDAVVILQPVLFIPIMVPLDEVAPHLQRIPVSVRVGADWSVGPQC